MAKAKLSKADLDRNEVVTKLGIEPRKFETAKVKALTDVQKAKLLEVTVAQLKTPIVLAPAAPVKGKSNLTIYTSLMVYPKFPAGTGQALFHSAVQWPTFPGAQVEFPRIKKGKKHLVEFNVQLNMAVTYHFRIFEYPLANFKDVSIVGPTTDTLVALVPPVDEIDGDLMLGASIQQRNSENDAAGWALYSVRITTT